MNISLLLVVVTVIYRVTADGNHSCPLWHYHHQGKCKCGDSLNGAILCSDDKILLRVDHVIDVWQNTTVAALNRYAYHNYSTIPSHLRVNSPIPDDTPPEELKGIMCNETNRMGFMCGKCLPTYGPSAYSIKCHECHLSLPSAIAFYLTIKLLPTAIFFIFIMMFRINIIKGPMLGYVLFCQVFIFSVRVNATYTETVRIQLNHTYQSILKFFTQISVVWSLDVTGIFEPICISDELEDYDVLFINYVQSALFPLCLVVITYILIELHARNYKVFVFCWKPFRGCFNKFGRNWSASDSIIHAFASLIFLSFTVLNYNFYELLSVSKVYTYRDGHPLKIILIALPTMEEYSSSPLIICYITVVVLLLIIFSILPTLVLLLYPFQMFQTLLDRVCSPKIHLHLNIFVDTFQSPFKNGCEGTRDFRITPGLVACIILLINILCCIANVVHIEGYLVSTIVICCILSSMLITHVRPCKSSSGNLSIIFHSWWLLASTAFFLLWKQDFVVSSKLLAHVFVLLVAVPHILIVMWLSYILQKKGNLWERVVACLNCKMGQHR